MNNLSFCPSLLEVLIVVRLLDFEPTVLTEETSSSFEIDFLFVPRDVITVVLLVFFADCFL